MLLDATGNPLPVRDMDGNELVVYRHGEYPHTSPLTDRHTPYNVQPVGQSGFGDPVFSDEFKAGSLDLTKWDPWYPDTAFWNTTTPGGHKTNTNEPQGYDETGITFDSDGMVFTYHESNHAVPELDFTSGMVTSYPSFNPLYGYFEAKLLLPNFHGSWPAFWMDPTDQVWPPEIDWMENWGKTSWNTVTKHGYIYPDGGGFTSTAHVFPTDVGNDWHVFGGLWEPGRLRWYVDGVLVKDLVDPTVVSKQMYLICNLAGDKDADPPVYPFSMKVRYIRAWALPGS